MSKTAGASCPSCGWHPCAEHAQKDQPPRWTCTNCGDNGFLSGAFTGRPVATPPATGPTRHKKHWRDIAREAKP